MYSRRKNIEIIAIDFDLEQYTKINWNLIVKFTYNYVHHRLEFFEFSLQESQTYIKNIYLKSYS